MRKPQAEGKWVGLSWIWICQHCLLIQHTHLHELGRPLVVRAPRFFSCLLCCFEVPLKQTAAVIANNFGFLFNGKSRAVFLIL